MKKFDDQDSYDGIWACALILHLSPNDSLSVFHKLNKALKENGIIYVSYKYGKHHEFNYAVFQICSFIDNNLNIEGFSKMMKDPSFCYKFYWLEAIVQLISEGKTETTFDEIIDEMIANAWYSVREFHIHLSGVPMDGQIKDGLERAVLQLTELSDLPANASKVQIKNTIQKYNKELKEVKEQLTHMVPYRALAGFFTLNNEKINWNSTKWLVAYIQKFNKTVVSLPYLLGTSSKLKKEVYFQQGWIKMIQDHTVNILGWIQYEKELRLCVKQWKK